MYYLLLSISLSFSSVLSLSICVFLFPGRLLTSVYNISYFSTYLKVLLQCKSFLLVTYNY